MPRIYDKVLKLAVVWKNKSARTHNNHINSGVVMVQPGGPGRGSQGGKGRRTVQGEKYGRGSGPGCGRCGGGIGSQKQPQQSQHNPEGEQAQPYAKRGPTGGCFHCQGYHYVCEWPEIAWDQNAQFLSKPRRGRTTTMVVMKNIMTSMESTKMLSVGSTWTIVHVMWKELYAW